MPFGLEDLEKVFEMTDLLNNKDEIIQEFMPEVTKILVKKDFFTGHFRTKYNQLFDELITSLLRKQVNQHLNLSPEELLLLTDTEFLKMIVPEYYNQDTYLPNKMQ